MSRPHNKISKPIHKNKQSRKSYLQSVRSHPLYAEYCKYFAMPIGEIFEERVIHQARNVMTHVINRTVYFTSVALELLDKDNFTFTGTLNKHLSGPVLEAKTLFFSQGEALEFCCVPELELRQTNIIKRFKLNHTVENETAVRATVPVACFAKGPVVFYFSLPDSKNLLIGMPISVSRDNTHVHIYAGNKYMTVLGASMFSYDKKANKQAFPAPPTLQELKQLTGTPALHAAALFNYPELSLYLLCNGFDVCARDFASRACWQIAGVLKHNRLEAFLRAVATTQAKTGLFSQNYATMLLDFLKLTYSSPSNAPTKLQQLNMRVVGSAFAQIWMRYTFANENDGMPHGLSVGHENFSGQNSRPGADVIIYIIDNAAQANSVIMSANAICLHVSHFDTTVAIAVEAAGLLSVDMVHESCMDRLMEFIYNQAPEVHSQLSWRIHAGIYEYMNSFQASDSSLHFLATFIRRQFSVNANNGTILPHSHTWSERQQDVESVLSYGFNMKRNRLFALLCSDAGMFWPTPVKPYAQVRNESSTDFFKTVEFLLGFAKEIHVAHSCNMGYATFAPTTIFWDASSGEAVLHGAKPFSMLQHAFAPTPYTSPETHAAVQKPFVGPSSDIYSFCVFAKELLGPHCHNVHFGRGIEHVLTSGPNPSLRPSMPDIIHLLRMQ